MINNVGKKMTVLFLSPLTPFVGVFVGVYTFFWGLWVLIPAWNVFEKGTQYKLLNMIAGEPVWGGVAFLLGMIIIKSCWSLKVETIRLASLASFYFWGLIASSYVYSDWRSPAFLSATFFSLLQGYAYINLTVRRKGEVQENEVI